MMPQLILLACAVLLVALLAAGLRGGCIHLSRRYPRPIPPRLEVRLPVRAEFAPADRAEAEALVATVTAHARVEDRETVARYLARAAACDIAKLRELVASLADGQEQPE